MRILVVDDDTITLTALRGLLSAGGHEVLTATTGEEAYDLLQNDGAPALALIDWMLPGMSGPELCRRLRASHKTSHMHLIMLTGRSGSDDLVTGLDAGANDFIVKPVNGGELEARIRAAGRSIDQQERLRKQASVDELTGVLNRGAIRDVLRRVLEHGRRTSGVASIILCDADRFKEVNDTHGHPIGDAVLRDLAKRLAERLRPYDILGRYGGEEFMVVLPSCALDEAIHVAERVRIAVCGEPIQTSIGPLPVTISSGMASAVRGGLSLDELVYEADRALYRAKAGGRNRVEGPAAQARAPR